MSIFTKTDADLLEKIKKDRDVSVKELDILRRKLEKIYFQGPKGEKLFIELEVNCNSPLLNVELVRLKVVDVEGKEKGDILTNYWVFQNKSVALWDVIAQLINQINSGPDQEWVVMEKDILE
jgi:hypothetical protein